MRRRLLHRLLAPKLRYVQRMKLARKLTLALVLGVLVVLALSASLRVRREAGLFEADIRRNSHTMGRALAAAIYEVWRVEGQARALRLVSEANERESHVDIRWVWLEAAAGDEHAPRLSLDELLPARAGREVVKKVLREGAWWIVTCVPVSIPDGRAGALELSESLAGERDYVRVTALNTVAATAALAVVCGLITISLGVWLVGRPMRALMDQARRIGAGDFSARPPLDQHDEIGELAVEMNRMSRRLEAAQEEVTRASQARIAALDQLRHAERLATVGKLASGIAHELGTPLQIVGGRAGLIADGDVEGDDIVASARIIREQSQRMAGIIRQLLDFARRRTVTKARVDLGRVVRDTCALLSPMADRKGVDIRLRSSAAPTEIECDAEQMQQALANVVLNAIQATPSGQEICVGIGQSYARAPAAGEDDDAEYVTLSVEDRGEGIPPDVKDHVFEPFFTTKPVGEGTGLGLSVAYGIVREHGGFIHVDSSLGHGARFTFYLPRGR